MDANHDHGNGCELVVSGMIHGAPGSDVDLTVAIETVVPDDEIPEIIGVYTTRARTAADGRFTDRYAVPDEMRGRLRGWVMCTVVVQPRVPGARSSCKVVRWQRSSSAELIAGLSALLASLSLDVAPIRVVTP
ncbi:MAG: hypothetical protein M3P52_06800 [Actinomycetota bacterium]|nr:hypothetical protein [Actinomycetota bacterium]